MKKLVAITIVLLLVSYSFSQIDKDTLKLNEVVISATRYQKAVKDIPAKVDVVKKQEIEAMPVLNTDDIFRSVGNIYVNRSWGIFSKNSSVTMRGLSSSARTLILLDGMPLNAAAGGSINWHMIDPDNIAKIEVTKGPNSALYGNNAMGGVINIITKRPIQPLTAQLNIYGGSYNTFGANLLLSGNNRKTEKDFTGAQMDSHVKEMDTILIQKV
jgi:iron complex outermembrane receptor protein